MKPKKLRLNETKPSFPDPPEKEKNKIKIKKAIFLLGISLIAFTVLKILLEFGHLWAFVLFELLGGIPIIIYVVIVRGRMGKIPRPEELPDNWSEDEKMVFIATEKQRKKDGQIYIYIAFPFIAAVLIGFITEFYVPMLFG